MPTYRITGVMRETGEGVTVEIDAANEGLAEKLADARGVRVSRVEQMGSSGYTVKEERAAAEAHARSKRQSEANAKAAEQLEWMTAVSPVRIEDDPARRGGRILRYNEQGHAHEIRRNQVVLGDLVDVKDGKAYLRVRQHGFIGGIAVGVALGLVLLWIGLFVLAALFWAGVFGAAAGAAGSTAPSQLHLGFA